MPKNKLKPLRAQIDADSVTIFCPCGKSITGEGVIIRDFKKLHKKHSNGKIEETITADGARFITFEKNKLTRITNI